MHLTPQERDKLLVHVAADVARRRLDRGLRLNHPEAVALITEHVLEGARDGRGVAELMDTGRTDRGGDVAAAGELLGERAEDVAGRADPGGEHDQRVAAGRAEGAGPAVGPGGAERLGGDDVLQALRLDEEPGLLGAGVGRAGAAG